MTSIDALRAGNLKFKGRIERTFEGFQEEVWSGSPIFRAFVKAETKEVTQRPPFLRDKLRIEGGFVYADEKNTDGRGNELHALFQHSGTCWNSSKDNARIITQMIQMNWNVMVFTKSNTCQKT